MKVVCYGDSNTYGFDPRSFFGSRYSSENRWVDILDDKTGWTIYNEGMNGREIPKHEISVPDDIDILIIMLGTNDLLQGKNLYEIAKNMESFLNKVTSRNVLLVAPPPLQLGEWVYDCETIHASGQIAALYRDLAKANGFMFADAGGWNVELLFDGVHFSEKGHLAFAEGMYHYLMNADIDSLRKNTSVDGSDFRYD